MIGRRLVLQALAASLAIAPLAVAAADPSRAAAEPAPVATVRLFCDSLLSVMKDGPALGFTGRRDRLAPAIRRTFDLPLMTRLMVGPQWPTIGAVQQQQLVAAFSDFSVATYASRFDDYSGERFDIDPEPVGSVDGDMIVRTRLVQREGEPVQLNYLMRNRSGAWAVIDVYLSGTISELATRRAEFGSVLRRSGPEALVGLLLQRTAKLSS